MRRVETAIPNQNLLNIRHRFSVMDFTSISSGLGWTGLDWAGLDWAGLDWGSGGSGGSGYI